MSETLEQEETEQPSAPFPRRTCEAEYLTLKELCARIKYAPQSVYNMIYRGQLIEGRHYVKPGKKLLFMWSAMEEWLHHGSPERHEAKNSSAPDEVLPVQSPAKSCRICI